MFRSFIPRNQDYMDESDDYSEPLPEISQRSVKSIYEGPNEMKQSIMQYISPRTTQVSRKTYNMRLLERIKNDTLEDIIKRGIKDEIIVAMDNVGMFDKPYNFDKIAMAALEKGYYNIVKWALDMNKDFYQNELRRGREPFSNTVLKKAFEFRNEKIAQYIVENIPLLLGSLEIGPVYHYIENYLEYLAKTNDEESIINFIETNGADGLYEIGTKMVITAIRDKKLDIIRFLLRNGYDNFYIIDKYGGKNAVIHELLMMYWPKYRQYIQEGMFEY
jgi:hypothetical protein